MKITLLLLVLLGITFGVKGQVVSRIDFDKIKETIDNPASPYYYPRQLKRLQGADTTLQEADYKYLYYGQVFATDYNPDEADHISEKFLTAYKQQEDYSKAAGLGERELSEHPFNLRLTLKLVTCYNRMKEHGIAQYYASRYFGMLAAIRSSGDGHSAATAFVPANVADEAILLTYYSLVSPNQALVEVTEVFDVEPDPENPRIDDEDHRFEGDKLYFNLTKPLTYRYHHAKRKPIANNLGKPTARVISQ